MRHSGCDLLSNYGVPWFLHNSVAVPCQACSGCDLLSNYGVTWFLHNLTLSHVITLVVVICFQIMV